MRSLKGLFFTAILLLSSVAAFAQAPAKNDIVAIFQRQADFKIRYALVAGGFNVKLHAAYYEETRQFKISWVAGAEREATPFLVMEDPLNYDAFAQRFYDSVKKKMGQTDLPAFSNSSIQEVYTWLFTLRIGNEDDLVNSGTLWLKKWVMVLGESNGNDGYAYHVWLQHRDSLVHHFANQYEAVDVYSNSLKSELDSLIKQAIIIRADTTVEAEAVTNAEKALKAKQNELDVVQARLGELKADTAATLRSINALNARKDSLKEQIALVNASTVLDEPKKKARTDTLNIGIGVCDALIKSKQEYVATTIEGLKTKDAAITALNVEVTKLETDLTGKRKIYKDKASKVKTKTDIGIALLIEILQKNSSGRLDTGTYNSLRRKILNDAKFESNFLLLADDAANAMFANNEIKKKYKDSLKLNSIYKINRVSLQFQRGALERIQVWIDNGMDGEDIYDNVYPFGMSSINNLKAFSDQKLILRPYSNYNYVMLSDVLGNYDNYLDLYTRDYSPADTQMNDINPSATPNIVLRKERLVNLFESKIYTDLEGVNANKPNGLVQIEVARRFNLNTARTRVSHRNNWTYFNHLNAYAAITKIEQKDRRLPLRNENLVVNNRIISPSYATNLDLRNYENAHLGLDYNLFLFDCPDGKFTFYVNTGLRYGHTALEDTVRTVTNSKADTPGLVRFLDAHSMTYALPKLSVELFSERRVGLTLAWQYNLTQYFSNNYFKPIMSYAKSDLTAIPIEKYARYSHMFEFFMRVETSKRYDSRLFLRARYFMQRGDVNTFFPQIQLGYAYNLILRK